MLVFLLLALNLQPISRKDGQGKTKSEVKSEVKSQVKSQVKSEKQQSPHQISPRLAARTDFTPPR